MQYGQIEIFRIRALRLNLEAGVFTEEHQELAARELALKCRIYATGCAKRGRIEEAKQYRELAESFNGS